MFTLARDEPGYPSAVIDALKGKAPEVLYCLGNRDLLNRTGVGFCGSRKSSQKGLETAQDCAFQVSEAGFNVISGNAAGVDFEAHKAALVSGGTTILVLPEGINHFRVKRAFNDVWDWERVLIVSQFEPDSAWKSFRAMERNQLIIALSKAMIVIEAGETGGTLNAGMATLKIGRPLFVALYENMINQAPGNDRLLQLGGQRLTKSRATGKAKLTTLFEEASKAYAPVSKSNQGQLGFL
ncbi:MAG: DNA-protecting protein DprA [Gammaproteobacteria bacterium]|nr:DNA-protecting protein DprA [Gammaproteobacteria bacterium]